MSRIKDLTGQKFEKLTVIEQTTQRQHGGIVWRCKCDCGNNTFVKSNSLVNGLTTSCGCVGLKNLNNFRENNLIKDTNLYSISSQKPTKNSTSGVKGVYWISIIGMWEVQIEFQKRRYHLGRYKSKEDAIEIHKLAEEKLHKKFLMENGYENFINVISKKKNSIK